MPRGSDESWVGKLNEKCAKYKHFEKARFGNGCKYEWFSFLLSLLLRFYKFFSDFLAIIFLLTHVATVKAFLVRKFGKQFFTSSSFEITPYSFVKSLSFIISAFVIKHFSDTVQYKSTGFLEKNRDTISKELVNVMRESNLAICRSLMTLDEHSTSQTKETSLDGRVKINAAKHLVNISCSLLFERTFFFQNERPTFFGFLCRVKVIFSLSLRDLIRFAVNLNIYSLILSFFVTSLKL